jgi:hypothetical protein
MLINAAGRHTPAPSPHWRSVTFKTPESATLGSCSLRRTDSINISSPYVTERRSAIGPTMSSARLKKCSAKQSRKYGTGTRRLRINLFYHFTDAARHSRACPLFPNRPTCQKHCALSKRAEVDIGESVNAMGVIAMAYHLETLRQSKKHSPRLANRHWCLRGRRMIPPVLTEDRIQVFL